MDLKLSDARRIDEGNYLEERKSGDLIPFWMSALIYSVIEESALKFPELSDKKISHKT